MYPLPLPALLTRRTVVSLGGAAIAAAFGVHSTLVVAQVATPAPPFAGKTSVGLTDDDKTLVAIVVAEGDGEAREARAYFCDADAIDLWMTGTATGDELFLTDGANIRLSAELGDESITGEMVFPDGAPLAFKAIPATGIAGLYDVVVELDGMMRGAAATGSLLEGRVEAEIATPVGVAAPFPYGAMVTITPQDEQPVTFERAISNPAEGTFRMIVLADSRSTGGGESATGTVKWKYTSSR